MTVIYDPNAIKPEDYCGSIIVRVGDCFRVKIFLADGYVYSPGFFNRDFAVEFRNRLPKGANHNENR